MSRVPWCAEQALAIDPNNAIAWSTLGYERTKLNEISGAIEACEQALAIAPNHASAWTKIGDAHVEQEDLAAATEAYERALAIDPDDEDTEASLKKVREMMDKP
ncbi:MAG TPA: tetratricopeptide repeat protein [Candidatus Lokiarchaeia archaeon]|nr:tetratricopeptide repeat protein [Candidatus Lokiarchaeia archaeon]